MPKMTNGGSDVRVPKPAAASRTILKKQYDVVIVGGGNATGYLCRELVEQKFEGSVLIISGENVAPYERPALTKAYLHPPTAAVRARLPGFHTCVGTGGDRQDVDWYKEHKINLLLKTLVTKIDPAMNTVQTNKHEVVRYKNLVHSCGSSSIKLKDFGIPGDQLDGVHYLREEADAKAFVTHLEKLKEENSSASVVIIGGGFIGLEVAAAVVGWGFRVSVISRGPIMQTFFPPHLVDKMTKEYKARDVKLVQGDISQVIRNPTKGWNEVWMKDGQVLKSHALVVGIGAKPKVILNDATMFNDCLVVNDEMRTSFPNILAIGDGASPLISGVRQRFQGVDWARKSAVFAARSICGVKYEFGYQAYNYSRVFEYTEKPIIWNFFGSTTGVVKVMKSKSGTSGSFWVADGKIVGALVFGNPSTEEFEEAKRLVTDAAAVPSTGLLYAAASTSAPLPMCDKKKMIVRRKIVKKKVDESTPNKVNKIEGAEKLEKKKKLVKTPSVKTPSVKGNTKTPSGNKSSRSAACGRKDESTEEGGSHRSLVKS